MPIETAVVEFAGNEDPAEARWRQWKMKGRTDDARFRQRLKTVIIDLAAVAAIGGGLWFAYGAITPLT